LRRVPRQARVKFHQPAGRGGLIGPEIVDEVAKTGVAEVDDVHAVAHIPIPSPHGCEQTVFRQFLRFGRIPLVLNRLFLQHRDLVDVFLYADKLQADSPTRLHQKLVQMQIPAETIMRRLKDLQDNQQYHATTIQKVIDEQMETTVGHQMNAGGGGKTVLDSVLSVLTRICPP
jgi:hypothetical protein